MPAERDPGEEDIVIDGGGGDGGGARRRENPDNDGDPRVKHEPDIEIVDDTPERDRGRKPLDHAVADPDDAELATYSAGVKKRMAELTHARHDERRRAEAAERERDEAVSASQKLLQQNRQLQQRTVSGENSVLALSKAQAEAALETARTKLKSAKEAFDTDAEMAAQEELVQATVALRELSRFKPQEVAVDDQDVVQLPAAGNGPAPVDQKTLRWQARNQWFGTDGNEEMTSFALGYHQKLVKAGVDPRSDDYFEKVDARLREVFPDFFSGDKSDLGESRTTQRNGARTSPVAPATRSANGVTKVRLTPTQIALAKRLGLTPQQYAQEVARLEQA